MNDRRLIEETFPVKEVSEESVKEKNIRHGHISTLHIWWARRPLIASRASVYASLVKVPENEDSLREKREFITKLSKWENSLNRELISKAMKDIIESNQGKPPKVLDPFAGGGSIPLEALRLGCETYASDYNPVATLILKCVLEYPQKFGKIEKRNEKASDSVLEDQSKNRLVEDVRKWGEWVLNEAKKELGKFYPQDDDGSVPVGYIWAKTIPCQNPSCGAEIPLMRQFWLAKKKKRQISLYPYVVEKQVNFKIVGTGYEKMPSGFDPSKGDLHKAIARCLVCGSIIDGKSTSRLFREGKSGQRMIAVVLSKGKGEGKSYRVANENDTKVFKEAEHYLEENRAKLKDEWGIDPIPDESLPPVGTLGFRIQRYGMNKWGDLFNARQKLALIIFTEKVREAYRRMVGEGYDKEYAKAVVTYLSFVVSRITDFANSGVRWGLERELFTNLFARHALPMTWNYLEINPYSAIANIPNSMFRQNVRVIDFLNQVKTNTQSSTIIQSSATSLPYPENYFDAVITDPPYYDNVAYSHLSDFFYVWLKRAIGDLYPELFATPLTPKSEEIVAYSYWEGGFEEGKKRFEELLKKSFSEIYRVLKPNGIAVIVYAHKSTAGWETLVNSLLDSGFVVSATWPIHTEMKSRLRAQESAALASSIYIVSRKSQRIPLGFYSEVKDELRKYLDKKLDRLWSEGISGSDFVISAIGSALEIFSKYEKVIDDSGNTINASRFLEDVRKIVTDYAIRQVLHNGFAAEISPMTRFYVLWRWAYQDRKIEFDEARKLGQGVGIDVAAVWNKGFIKKEKEYIEVLGPEERSVEDLKDSSELIDVMHYVLLLWKAGKQNEIIDVLDENGYGKSDVFYRVAQAIAESLPDDNKEKKLLEGFLAGKDRIKRGVGDRSKQMRLF